MAGKKRKQAADTQAGPSKAKKQAKVEGQKAISRDINVKVDEGFGDYGKSISKHQLCPHGQGETKVYIDGDGMIYDVSMNQTNIGNNNNKYYHLQLLEKDGGKTYYTHTRWGRVGDSGQVRTVGPIPFESALKEFEKKFKEKSGHKWEDRGEEPKPKKYTYLEKNYESDDEDTTDTKNVKDEEEEVAPIAQPKSTLPVPTQRLMELIFNQNHFNSVLESMGYNANKLPLGKLGENTLKKGFEHLKELANLIAQPSLAETKYEMSQSDAIQEFSNRYYSTIPHIFGHRRPPMIDHDGILRQEVSMLDTLSTMNVANEIMKASNNKKTDAESINIIDQRFNSLQMNEMTPLLHKSKEFKNLADYLVKSAGQTHGIEYSVQDIFRIERQGENDRFEKSEYANIKNKNRRLLWHGSRTTNFGGILSQGLRIAPPEAPVNGYAFGKGIYCADASTKSANYCLSGQSNNTGLLLLCEVELGDPMYEIPTGNSNAQSDCKKNGSIATLGVGRTVPLGWRDAGCVHNKLKGVLMPDPAKALGDNKDMTTGYLQYNEYIVYNIAQIRLRYLLRVGM
ncbi:poly-ribose polymerase [Aulographum hederae CBS 113979]|uniref:Poly [ADP-ribose] polymerase n=1 Tax=Aulographum hederae CBS 113979 TaxID=1176131 RepID=A0A6G1H503_9PEZI|nr:poly-ribose polymerase [Aulographum hederae CBS 113979]